MSYRSNIYKWLPEEHGRQAICPHLLSVLDDWNSRLHIRIKDIGLDNVKAPDTIVFMDGMIPNSEIDSATSRHVELIRGVDGNLWCKECSLCVTYE